MSRKFGVSNGVIFRVGDWVEFRRPPPDKVYVLKEFLKEDYVELRGKDNPKDSAFCNLDALRKVL